MRTGTCWQCGEPCTPELSDWCTLLITEVEKKPELSDWCAACYAADRYHIPWPIPTGELFGEKAYWS